MHLKYLQLIAIFAAAAPAFPPPAPSDIRIYRFVDIKSDMSYQEMVSTIRQVAGVTPELPLDPASRTLTISASPEKLAVVDWIVNELDAKKAELPALGSAPKQHQFTAANGNVVDVFYLDPTATVLDVQETITVLRQVADVNHVFSYMARKAIVLQAPSHQAGLSEWLVPRLAKQDRISTAGDEYKMPGVGDDVTRVFHWNNSLSPPEVVQLAHDIRVQGEVTHLFTCFGTHVLAVRGTPAQLATVDEMVTRAAPPR